MKEMQVENLFLSCRVRNSRSQEIKIARPLRAGFKVTPKIKYSSSVPLTLTLTSGGLFGTGQRELRLG